MVDFSIVTQFENRVAEFFGSPYAVAVDSCTHGIELCLRYRSAAYIISPFRTYLSVPMLGNKLNLPVEWSNLSWKDYYSVHKNIYDAAVLWKEKSYVPETFMCISFQYQKHLSLGRGGMVLCDDAEAAKKLKMMSYDGRLPGIPWREQNIYMMGYHYYMTPDTAQLGLEKLPNAIKTKPRQWVINDWPDLTQMEIFKK
jgi:dTDP-4-amino-4,6-dideoxygalactose transaminase